MSDGVTTTTGQTERLCEFIQETTFDDIPKDVVDHVKRMIIDSVAVTLATTNSGPASVVRTANANAYSDDGDARILGTGEQGTVTDVAHITGITAHALDFDDVHHRMGGHPSIPVLSALLPVGEHLGASGQDLIRSFVLRTEVEVMLADVLNPGHYERGWHPMSVLGTIGAAAAVSDLLGSDVDKHRHALGIAASKASGSREILGR